MTLKRAYMPITVTAGGAATVLWPAVLGKLFAVEYLPGTLDTGSDLTLTCEAGGSKPLLSVTDAGTSNIWLYPRDLVHAVAGGAALTGTAGGDRAQPLMAGVPKLVVAQGGASKAGGMNLFYDE